MPAPLAYFLTWTTYGTRLHGDVRGTVDRDHNRPGTPFLPADESRVLAMREKMLQPPYLMDEDAQAVVQAAIREHAEVKGWRILALATPGTRVHLVIDCRRPGVPLPPPERVLQSFKSWVTRALRERGLAGPDRRVWTDHGSTRWINNAEGLQGALDYVRYGQ